MSEKNEERTTSDYMLEIAGHYLMNGCDDCPFYDIVKTCDSVPIHCNWMSLKNYFKAEEENPALSWDELKTMEGMPVWVEGKTVKHWAVITGIYYDDLNEGYLLETYYAEKQGSNTSRRKRSTLGKTWQVYRKENV